MCEVASSPKSGLASLCSFSKHGGWGRASAGRRFQWRRPVRLERYLNQTYLIILQKIINFDSYNKFFELKTDIEICKNNKELVEKKIENFLKM